MKLKTKELTTCALFAALIAIGAFIKVDKHRCTRGTNKIK